MVISYLSNLKVKTAYIFDVIAFQLYFILQKRQYVTNLIIDTQKTKPSVLSRSEFKNHCLRVIRMLY